MGCCYSSDTASEQNGDYNERSHLLANPISNNIPASSTFIREDNSSRHASSLPKRKSDEQSALNRILHETATNIIDVSALENHTIEQHEYMERSKTYLGKLQSLAVSSASGKKLLSLTSAPSSKSLLLDDVANVERILSAPPISDANNAMMRNTTRRLNEAVRKIKVEHREELVVQFGIPQEVR